MAKVKIITVPPGGAPFAVRREWIGLELPLIEDDLEPGVFRSVTGGKPDPRSFGGFPVKTEDAIKALRDNNREDAADWWEAWFHETGGTGKTLVFAPACGELVVEATMAQPKKHVAAMTAANKRK